MQKCYFLLAAFAMLFTSIQAPAFSPVSKNFKFPEGVTTNDYQAGKVVFKVNPAYRSFCSSTGVVSQPLNNALYALGCTSVAKVFPGKQKPEQEKNTMGMKMADLSLIYYATINPSLSIEKSINLLMASGILEYAEPCYVHHVNYTPNDPQTGQQYFLNKIQAYAAWDIQQGDTAVVIGIVDSGTDWDHPDLQANLKLNYADPINGVDDDGDGYIDNYRGWDLSENDNDPMIDMSDHGSHVSGCADAVTDNSIGVAGPGFKCKFLPVKCANATATTQIDKGYEGIVYAADHGCAVINCSWGGAGGGQMGQDVLTYASVNMGALVICAAGNTYTDVAQYPAAFQYAFSVAATSSSDVKSTFSTYNYSVDIAAPGSGIYSTIYNNTYQSLDGTSMASPITAGCAAIVKSQFPSYNNFQIGEQLRTTADNIYTLAGNANYQNKLGGGRVNLFRALTETPKSALIDNLFVTDNNDLAFGVGDTLAVSGDIFNYLAPLTNLTVTLSSTSPYVTILNGTINPGAMATLSNINTVATPFTMLVGNNPPVNSNVVFKITMTDGTYTSSQFFSVVVNVDYLNVAINDIATTITSKGRLFYYGTGQAQGLGFTYNGNNLVYDGGLMLGNNSKVSDNCRDGANFDDDLRKAIAIQKILPSVASEYDLVTTFNDNNVTAADRLKVTVTHKTYAWSTPGNTKFIIVEYKIKNTGTTALSTLYAGIAADWDIQTFGNNKADVDNTLKMGYSYCTDAAGLYAGTKLLTPGTFVNYSIDNVTGGGGGVDATTDWTSAEKYTTLSTQRAQAGNTVATGNDVMQVVSSGPFNLAAGDSVTVAFALLAGDDLTDLQASAAAAQIKYDGVVSAVTPLQNSSSQSLNIFGLYPNPSQGDNVTISFSTPANNQPVKIEVLDVAGRSVAEINSAAGKSGLRNVTLETKNLSKGVYTVRLKMGTQSQTTKLMIQ